MNEKEIRAALGIADGVDIVVAIAELQARNAELAAAVASDGNAADARDVATLRRDLADAEKRYLAQEAENGKRIIALEEARNRERAIALVDTAIAKGRLRPANREMALKLALRDPADFEEFVSTLTPVDLRERGAAGDGELAELEPTAGEIEVLTALGQWNKADPTSSRLAVIRSKAKERGITLPDGFTGQGA